MLINNNLKRDWNKSLYDLWYHDLFKILSWSHFYLNLNLWGCVFLSKSLWKLSVVIKVLAQFSFCKRISSLFDIAWPYLFKMLPVFLLVLNQMHCKFQHYLFRALLSSYQWSPVVVNDHIVFAMFSDSVSTFHFNYICS